MFNLTSEDRFVVLGSNSLWQQVKSNDCAKIVQEALDKPAEVVVEGFFTKLFKAADSSQSNVDKNEEIFKVSEALMNGFRDKVCKEHGITR